MRCTNTAIVVANDSVTAVRGTQWGAPGALLWKTRTFDCPGLQSTSPSAVVIYDDSTFGVVSTNTGSMWTTANNDSVAILLIEPTDSGGAFHALVSTYASDLVTILTLFDGATGAVEWQWRGGAGALQYSAESDLVIESLSTSTSGPWLTTLRARKWQDWNAPPVWTVTFPAKRNVFTEPQVSDRHILLVVANTNVTVQMEALDIFTGQSQWLVNAPTISNWTGIVTCRAVVGSEFWYMACTPFDQPCYGHPVLVQKRSLSDGTVVWTQPSTGWVVCQCQQMALSANEDILYLWSNWGGDPQPDNGDWIAAINTTSPPLGYSTPPEQI